MYGKPQNLQGLQENQQINEDRVEIFTLFQVIFDGFEYFDFQFLLDIFDVYFLLGIVFNWHIIRSIIRIIIRNYKIDLISILMIERHKIFILIITTAFLVAAFVINTWYSWQVFKYNLTIVPEMQKNVFLGSSGFIILMNIVSNIFNPIVCAGYIMAFYLLSHRRFEILVFLIWFIFLSVFLTFIKSLVQQARPFWIDYADVQMRQWTCYTEFGNPSGHSMLGLILIQFIIRYLSRSFNIQGKTKIGIIAFGIFLQFLVVYSRMILGMHSLNQVLFGILLGLYSFLPYYMYMEKFILKICLRICNKAYRRQNLIVNTILVFVMLVLSLFIAFVPEYGNNDSYLEHIKTFQKCEGVKVYQSFQYKCLQDSSLVMAAFGAIYGLIFLKNQERLMKVVIYPRSTKKYIIRLILSAIFASIPVAIFMNPFWKKLDLSDENMAIMLFFLQSAGLMAGNFVLVGLGPTMLSRLKLENYFTHDQGKQFLSYSSQSRNVHSQISQKTYEVQIKQKLLDSYQKNESINIPIRRKEQQSED